MSDSISKPDSRSKRPWIAPTLTRHETLAALTQTQDPQYPPGMGPYGPYPPGFGPYADSIPGSTGFFP